MNAERFKSEVDKAMTLLLKGEQLNDIGLQILAAATYEDFLESLNRVRPSLKSEYGHLTRIGKWRTFDKTESAIADFIAGDYLDEDDKEILFIMDKKAFVENFFYAYRGLCANYLEGERLREVTTNASINTLAIRFLGIGRPVMIDEHMVEAIPKWQLCAELEQSSMGQL